MITKKLTQHENFEVKYFGIQQMVWKIVTHNKSYITQNKSLKSAPLPLVGYESTYIRLPKKCIYNQAKQIYAIYSIAFITFFL